MRPSHIRKTEANITFRMVGGETFRVLCCIVLPLSQSGPAGERSLEVEKEQHRNFPFLKTNSKTKQKPLSRQEKAGTRKDKTKRHPPNEINMCMSAVLWSILTRSCLQCYIDNSDKTS